MTNRKKRLQKGIASLECQISLHAEKLMKAEEEENVERADYQYRKEIAAKKKDLEEKKRLLDKGG
jgi:hypothetical protein